MAQIDDKLAWTIIANQAQIMLGMALLLEKIDKQVSDSFLGEAERISAFLMEMANAAEEK